jgi:ankyrin repeat protein
MKSKIGVLIFSGLFMLGFGGFGIFVGANQLWQHASGALRAMRMVAVEATVDVAALNQSRGSKGGTVYRVDTKYTYKYDRETFSSTRLGFGSPTTSDSSAAYHRDWVQRLQQAQNSGQQIAVWVDPSEPTYAVLDKTIRWTMVFFMLPFAILFPAIGIGAGYVFVKTLFTPASEISARPKPARRAANASQLKPKASGIKLLVGAAALAVFSSPFIAGGLFGDAPFPFALISILLIVGVLGLLVSGVKALIFNRAAVRPTVAMNPAQPRAGEHVSLRLTYPNALAADSISLVFTCHEHDARGAGSSTLRVKTRLNAIATRVRNAKATPCVYEAKLLIPSHAPATIEIAGGQSFRWSLEIEKSAGVVSYDFDFVLRPGEPSAFANATALESTAEATAPSAHMPIPASVATITQRGKAWTATFPAPGLHAGPITLLLIGLGCLGWVARSVFANTIAAHEIWMVYAPTALLGVVALGYALHFATRKTQTTISPQGLTRTRESVLHAGHWRVPLAHIKAINAGERYEQNSVPYAAAMLIQTMPGKSQAVSPALGKLGVTNAIVAQMQTALANVKEYGITPAPNAAAPALYSSPVRVLSAAMLLSIAALTYGALYMVASARGPAFIAATADQLNIPQTRAQRKAADRANFTPADPKRFDALMAALDDKNVSAMEALLNDGADANTTRWDGYTLLIRAAYNNDAPMVKLLLKHRADPNLAMAAPHERAGVTALSDALYRKNISMANALIEAGARTDNATCCGWTLAHVAAESDSVEVLEFVAARDVPLNAFAKGSRGETPLMVAARYGGLNAIRWLHEKGVDKNVRDPYGYNAVGWAMFFKQSAAQQLLVELGADADTGAKAKP